MSYWNVRQRENRAEDSGWPVENVTLPCKNKIPILAENNWRFLAFYFITARTANQSNKNRKSKRFFKSFNSEITEKRQS